MISLEFDDSVRFFGRTLRSLHSFKEATRGAVLNMINGKLKEGISLNAVPESRLSNTSFGLVNGALLMTTNFDIERSFHQHIFFPAFV